MLYVKFFITVGLLLLAAEAALSHVKNSPPFIQPENKPLDFKDMIIKKLIMKLNEALHKCNQPEQLPPQQQLPIVPPKPIHQRPESNVIPPAHAPMPQQKVIQHQKQIISEPRHLAQPQNIPHIPPQQILQHSHQVRPLPMRKIEFSRECPCQQQQFENDGQYDYEEVQCPCCECGGNCEKIQCPCCQDIQYEDVTCPCCERQQTVVEDPFNRAPYTEVQPIVNGPRTQYVPQSPQSFPQQIRQQFPQQNINPIGLQEQRIITTGPIFKETFVAPLFSPSCDTVSRPNLNHQQGPMTHLPPLDRTAENQDTSSPQTINFPQISHQPQPVPQQQPPQAFVIPGRVQVERTIMPTSFHPLFFTGYMPGEEKPIEKPFQPILNTNAQVQKFIHTSQNDNC